MRFVKWLLMVPGSYKKELTKVGRGVIPIIMKNKVKGERPRQATTEAQ
jgi:hypothetical protein